MTLALRDVVDGAYKPDTLSQATVVSRIQDLAREGDSIAAHMRRLQVRLAQLKVIMPELLLLLDNMPNEGCNDPTHFGGSACD